MFDTTEYLHQLNENTEAIIGVAQANVEYDAEIPSDGKWSTLLIMEHLYIVDRAVMAGMLNKHLEKHDTAEIFGQQKLNRIIVEMRGRKVVAPDGMIPSGQFESMQQFMVAFAIQRSKLRNYILEEKIIVDQRYYKHPYLGEMTISDWCYFIIAHARRHLLQIHDRKN
jgi:DinB superfamily